MSTSYRFNSTSSQKEDDIDSTRSSYRRYRDYDRLDLDRTATKDTNKKDAISSNYNIGDSFTSSYSSINGASTRSGRLLSNGSTGSATSDRLSRYELGSGGSDSNGHSKDHDFSVLSARLRGKVSTGF